MSTPKKYLTIVSCIKDEESYIVDFVKYHRYVGVDKFIFFDRGTEVKHLFSGDADIEITHFPEPGLQAEAFSEGIIRTKNQTFWAAFIDIDQALVPQTHNNVKEVLKDYESFASLQINWATFGSSGKEIRTIGSLYERFLMKAKDVGGTINEDGYKYNPNYVTQSIVQPTRVIPSWIDPHHPVLKKNEIAVNENKIKVDGPFCEPSYKKLWCAHYYTKSKEEWAIKNAKGRADIRGRKIPFNIYEQYNEFCNAIEENRVLELWRKSCI